MAKPIAPVQLHFTTWFAGVFFVWLLETHQRISEPVDVTGTAGNLAQATLGEGTRMLEASALLELLELTVHPLFVDHLPSMNLEK